MHKIVYIISYLWNVVMLKLVSSEYEKLPKIVGFLKVKGLKGKVYFGKDVYINSNQWINPVGMSSCTYLCVNPNAVIKIGNNVMISNSLFFAFKSITIEDNVMIGGGCEILDNDFHSMDYDIRISRNDQQNVISNPIIIRKGAFIGTRSIILKGVEIGERSIIAAGSIVTKNVPAFEVWGGNPARFIKAI